MAEQRIDIVIDENGRINASTEGLKGEICLSVLEGLLGQMEDAESITKTDEYYQMVNVQSRNTVTVGGKK
jgi:hypothetical protein